MECPLFKDKCIESQCAWYVKQGNRCAVVGLVDILNSQAGTVRDILDHMQQSN